MKSPNSMFSGLSVFISTVLRTNSLNSAGMPLLNKQINESAALYLVNIYSSIPTISKFVFRFGIYPGKTCFAQPAEFYWATLG